MDPGYSPANRQVIEKNAEKLHIPITIFESDIFESVFHVEKSPCYLCARMRRGHLYSKAKELGCNKIAYAHHRDDVNETFLMSLIYEGRIHTFSPMSHLDKTGLTLIRPLLFAPEADIIGFCNKYELPVIKNLCPADGVTKRHQIKELIKQINNETPGFHQRMFSAIIHGNMDDWPERNEHVRRK